MLYDRSLFLAHGQDPRRFDAVVVKSPHCQPRFFRDWAARIDQHRRARAPPARTCGAWATCVCPRPMFPLDDDVTFTPRVQLYSRPRYGVLPAAGRGRPATERSR